MHVQMGLGKTLCVISLIISDIVERQQREGSLRPDKDVLASSAQESGDGEESTPSSKGKERIIERESAAEGDDVDGEREHQNQADIATIHEEQNASRFTADSGGAAESEGQLEEYEEEIIDDDLIMIAPPSKRQRLSDDEPPSSQEEAFKNHSPPEKPTATLIVCPLSILSNWEQQIYQHVNKEWMEARYDRALRISV